MHITVIYEDLHFLHIFKFTFSWCTAKPVITSKFTVRDLLADILSWQREIMCAWIPNWQIWPKINNLISNDVNVYNVLMALTLTGCLEQNFLQFCKQE